MPKQKESPSLDPAAAHRALTARDPRFDGVFFFGVTSTGIYCRPICTARTPKQENCRFFNSAEAAEKAAFRPCLRCRPELAPGNAPVDGSQRIAQLLARRIEEGLADDGAGLEEIAGEFSLSTRQLRRIVQRELGVAPIELMQTRRLLLAKQLLTETHLPITRIAFASGFASLRRFNDAFVSRYRMPPTRLRKQATGLERAFDATDTSTLQLAYRPPYDWAGLLAFLKLRAIAGVELIDASSYRRTVRMGAHHGWIAVCRTQGRETLTVEFTHSLTPVLPALLGRLRNLFDLDARPDLIASHLGKDAQLRHDLRRNPGLRVPGAWDGFELAVRAILGQQVSVKGATTLACRFAEAYGEPIETSVPGLSRLSPTPERLARAPIEAIAKLGIPRSRATCISALARTLAAGELSLEPGAHPEEAVKQLMALRGIGSWTAHYIAMRALRWPDAFPTGDIVLLRNLGGISAARADSQSQAWRPWRSYAVMHLWRRAPALAISRNR